jgi:hypothetical protein
MSQFWWRLRHNFLFSWRLWLALLALVMMQAVLHKAVGLSAWVVMVFNCVVGAWLGKLAGKADIEERDERHEAAWAAWQARWDQAVRDGLGLEPRHADQEGRE